MIKIMLVSTSATSMFLKNPLFPFEIRHKAEVSGSIVELLEIS